MKGTGEKLGKGPSTLTESSRSLALLGVVISVTDGSPASAAIIITFGLQSGILLWGPRSRSAPKTIWNNP